MLSLLACAAGDAGHARGSSRRTLSSRRMLSLLALGACATGALAAGAPGTFELAGNTGISAMMVFLGNEEKVYVLDKSENNPVSIAGHPAWGAVWDINTHQTTIMDVYSNTFCASGMHLPNGSFATFGGNHGVSPSPNGPVDFGGGDYDPNRGVAPIYGAADGRRAIRLLTPCTGDSASFAAGCQWYENRFDPGLLMQTERWYPGTEPLGDGSIVILGGMVSGGYINRLLSVQNDPVTWGGVASNNYEFFPARPGFNTTTVDFLVNAGGLNLYSHMYLMPSGKMFVQANVSTMLWDVDTNTEFPLPPMPGGVVRVYPASGATAMLPLTPDNGWTPTILFCGGSNGFTDAQWGDQLGTAAPNWLVPASTDCQRITPEPTDGSAAAYTPDDPLPIGRTMGQFIHLPDETMLIINGGANGTAAYDGRGTPYGQSLATAEVLTPAIYNPNAPAGQRFSSAGLSASTIPRLYHSAAIILPDASVFVAGSNPNEDYNATTVYPTESRVEIFYPPYFNATRPAPQGVPTTLTYGGPYFNVTLNSTGGYTGDADTAAASAKVVIIRGGFTTHGMNMGQRFMRLNSTYSIDPAGTITLHVAQLPPNANLFQPGPALLFVVVDGVPSHGTLVTIGSGNIETQPLQAVAVLPPSGHVAAVAVPGKANGAGAHASGFAALSTGAKVAIFAGGGAALAGALALLVLCAVRARRRVRAARGPWAYTPTGAAFAPQFAPGIGDAMGAGAEMGAYPFRGHRFEDSYGSQTNLMGAPAPAPSGYLTPYNDESANPSMEHLHAQPMRHS